MGITAGCVSACMRCSSLRLASSIDDLRASCTPEAAAGSLAAGGVSTGGGAGANDGDCGGAGAGSGAAAPKLKSNVMPSSRACVASVLAWA